MHEWISKATCAKYRKKGHLVFNVPQDMVTRLLNQISFQGGKNQGNLNLQLMQQNLLGCFITRPTITKCQKPTLVIYLTNKRIIY